MDHLATVSPESEIGEESRPTELQRNEIFVVACFCAFTQGFTSLLLFQDFIKENKDNEN